MSAGAKEATATLSLAARLDAIHRLCFEPVAPPDVLALLGHADRWMVYRGLVRGRLYACNRVAFPRAAAAIGRDEFDALVSAWLDDTGPTERFYRNVPLEFTRHAMADVHARSEALAELLRFEAAQWRSVHGAPEPSDAPEFAFDQRPVVSPTAMLLRLHFDVHNTANDTAIEHRPRATSPQHVCVYRTRDNHHAVWNLNPIAHTLMQLWTEGRLTFAEAANATAAAHQTAITPTFVEGLSTLLAEAMAAGILRNFAP